MTRTESRATRSRVRGARRLEGDLPPIPMEGWTCVPEPFQFHTAINA
jgi:hypothetical protein